MERYRCQLERLGAPAWSCGVASLVGAVGILIGTLYASVGLWDSPHRPPWLLPLIWGLGILAISLAVRSALRVLLPHSGSDGSV